MNARLLIVLFCLMAGWVHGAPLVSEFRPGQPRPDSQGEPINAHGGGVLLYRGVYYWFGQPMPAGPASNAAPAGVQVYSSADLYNWKNEGWALQCSDDQASELAKGCLIDCPRVVFNSRTGKFVMWFHLELKNSSNATARAGVAVADQPTGPYRYSGSFRLNAGRLPRTVSEVSQVSRDKGPWNRDLVGGQMSRGMTLFVDDDGTAYQVAVSEDNQTLHISRLAEDYLRTSGEYARVFPGGQNGTPALFKHNGKYWMITSDCAPRSPRSTRLAVADSIWGPWTASGNPWVTSEGGNNYANQMQPGNVLPVAGSPGAFIFMGDLWQSGSSAKSRPAWLPIQFRQDGRPFLQWLDQWDLGFFDQSKQPIRAELDSSGRTITISAPGILSFQAGFEAHIVTRVSRMFSSRTGTLIEPVKKTDQVTPLGRAQVMTSALRFEKEQMELHCRLVKLLDVPAVTIQIGLRNVSSQKVNLVWLTSVQMDLAATRIQTLQVIGDPSEWLVTPLDKSTELAQSPAVALNKIWPHVNVFEYGGFYRADGKGFLFGPVGEPVAYLSTTVANGGNGKAALSIQSDMSMSRVEPGELRWGQQVVLLLEPPRQALPRWAEWVAKSHRARTDKGALSGWSSWYHLTDRVAGNDVLSVADAVAQSGGRLRPQAIVLDDGYQNLDGQWEANAKFPEGLPWYAQRLARTGARPGLWMAPTLISPDIPWVKDPENLTTVWGREFDPPIGSRFKGSGWIDPTNPRARARIAERIRYAVESGFTFLKLDFNSVGTGWWYEKKKTSFEVLRDHYANIRQAAGEDTYILFCEPQPNRATVGLVDAGQVCHAAWRGGVRSAMNDLLRAYPLNRRWFAVDPSCYYLATDLPGIGRIEGGWPLVKTWISMVGLSCGSAMTSDPWAWEDFKPYWKNAEILTPPAQEHTEVLDLCTRKEWPRLVGLVKRDWGTAAVALLWNPGTVTQSVALDFAQAGLDPKREYAVWSFWDNQFLGFAKGTWITPPLPEAGSQHLRLTEVDRARRAPTLVGSTLHIYCGAADIARFHAGSKVVELDLSDAGARAGHLWVYSPERLFLRKASGCEVTAVERVNEAMWRIAVTNRLHGQPQRIQLGIAVPLTQQAWFWVVTGLSVLMAGFGLWWHLQRQRAKLVLAEIEHQRAMDQERLRIARDIHDDLGASLTQIALLSELAQTNAHDHTQVRAHTDEIFQTARTLTRSVDEIVWAVNPANDTLDKFVTFVSQSVQNFLNSAGLACQLEIPDSLPAWPMTSLQRHHLFLVVREAIHNIITHAAARKVRFTLRLDGANLAVEISDDGRGFDPQAVDSHRPGGGVGLVSMRERMVKIGGTLTCVSAPGQGTTLFLKVKLSPTILRP